MARRRRATARVTQGLDSTFLRARIHCDACSLRNLDDRPALNPGRKMCKGCRVQLQPDQRSLASQIEAVEWRSLMTMHVTSSNCT